MYDVNKHIIIMKFLEKRQNQKRIEAAVEFGRERQMESRRAANHAASVALNQQLLLEKASPAGVIDPETSRQIHEATHIAVLGPQAEAEVVQISRVRA